jgi:hypothetical protein
VALYLNGLVLRQGQMVWRLTSACGCAIVSLGCLRRGYLANGKWEFIGLAGLIRLVARHGVCPYCITDGHFPSSEVETGYRT